MTQRDDPAEELAARMHPTYWEEGDLTQQVWREEAADRIAEIAEVGDLRSLEEQE